MNATKPCTIVAVICCVLGIALALQAVTPLRAQPPGPGSIDLADFPSGVLPPGLASREGYVTVIAELTDAPVLAAPPSEQEDAVARQRHLERIDSAQQQMRNSLGSLGAQELYHTRLVYNGIALRLPSAHLAQLRSLPGVKDIHLLTPKRIDTIKSVPFVGAPTVWGSGSGATGRNTRIGIIDSGIDYTHAIFGGSGTAAAYSSNNPATIEPGSFPTAKVAGGYDFAGNGYDSENAPFPSDDDNDGRPGDSDPLDCNGHGTLVAGVAAGFGVTTAGTTYRGPYTSQLNAANFAIGPGVAPNATLYALKVLGCRQDDASTTLLMPAIEWAADPNGDGNTADHLDVVAVALGSPFGSATDPDAAAATAASAAGVVVVASAGNTNGTFYSINSPASAPAAIAVTPIYDTRTGAPGAPDSLLPESSRGPLRDHVTTKPDIAAPGYAIQSAAVGSGKGAGVASGSSMATPHVAGAAALLRELYPRWRPVQVKAAMMNTATPIQDDTGDPYGPTLGGLGRLNVAAAAKTKLLAYADDGTGGVGVDYGIQWVNNEFRNYRAIRIDNLGTSSQQIGLGSFAAASEPNIEIRPAQVDVTVPAKSSKVVRVRGQVLNNQLEESPDPAVPPLQNDFERFSLAEQAGSIYIVEGSNARIRVANGSSEPAIDVYLNSTRIASNLRYGQVSSYVARPAGSYTLTYYRAGAKSATISQADDEPPETGSNGNTLGSRILNIGAGTDVTMLARDVLNDPGEVRTRTLNEAAVQGAIGVGRVRFVNNNPANSPLPQGLLDVYLDSKLVAKRVAPIEITNFVATTPGTHLAQFYAAGAQPLTSIPLATANFSVNEGALVTVAAAPLSTGAQALTIQSQPRTTIRVPYALVPRSASQSLVTSVQPIANTTTVSLTVTNSAAPVLTDTYGLRPLLGAFELTYRSSTPSDGTKLDAARLRYAGIATDYALVGQNVFRSQLFFAVAAQGPWATPHEVEYNIFIDTNLDGTDDYILSNTDLGTLRRQEPTDTFISALFQRAVQADGTSGYNLAEVSYLNSFDPPNVGQPDLSPFDRQVFFMRVSADGLGLAPGRSQFRYRIETRHRDRNEFAELVDSTPWLTYDVSQPAIDTANMNPRFVRTPVYAAFNGASFAVRLNPALVATQPDPQVLIFHFHNAPGQQVQLVPVSGASASP